MNYSRITDSLYIGTTPKGEDYATLHELGVELVINMRIATPPRRDPTNTADSQRVAAGGRLVRSSPYLSWR